MLDDTTTNLIEGAIGSGDIYAWSRLMAGLAGCDPSELDAGAIYECVRQSAMAGAPREVNALRAFDAAGSLVRAEHAFSGRSARRFDERFADARVMLATRAAQHGYDVTDPAATARAAAAVAEMADQAVDLMAVAGRAPRRAAGCGVFVALSVLLTVGGAALAIYFAVGSTARRAVPEVRKIIEDGIADARLSGDERFGMTASGRGSAVPAVWRTLVEPGQVCRWALGTRGQAAAAETGIAAGADTRRSVAVRVEPNQDVFADGCRFAVATPPTPVTPPYEGDYIVGVDVPSGTATVRAGDGLCLAELRRYHGGTVAKGERLALVSGRSGTLALRPAADETIVVRVTGCAITVAA